MERIVIKQDRGPRLDFKGEWLCETEFEWDQGETLLELYQSKGGALIAYSEVKLHNTGDIIRRAHVVEPRQDEAAMQREVMDFFDWSNHARSMVKDIGWKLVWKVA